MAKMAFHFFRLLHKKQRFSTNQTFFRHIIFIFLVLKLTKIHYFIIEETCFGLKKRDKHYACLFSIFSISRNYYKGLCFALAFKSANLYNNCLPFLCPFW